MAKPEELPVLSSYFLISGVRALIIIPDLLSSVKQMPLPGLLEEIVREVSQPCACVNDEQIGRGSRRGRHLFDFCNRGTNMARTAEQALMLQQAYGCTTCSVVVIGNASIRELRDSGRGKTLGQEASQ
jgi:hypothetical protein